MGVWSTCAESLHDHKFDRPLRPWKCLQVIDCRRHIRRPVMMMSLVVLIILITLSITDVSKTIKKHFEQLYDPVCTPYNWLQPAASCKQAFNQLSTEVGLGLRDIAFDVDPATPRKRAHPPHPIFGPCLLWPNGWMDEDAAWYGSRPRPRPHCIRRGPSSRRRGTAAPLFSTTVYCGHGRPSQLLLSSC